MEREKRVVVPPKQYMTTELLIREVRQYPVLWDETNLQYKDRDVRRVLWNRIASQFVGGSPKEAKKAWDSLRRALANCRNKYAKMHGASGSAGVPYKPYKYEREMSFLDGFNGHDHMEGNLGVDEDLGVDILEDENEVEEDEDNPEEQWSLDINKNKSESPSPIKVENVKGLKLEFQRSDDNLSGCDGGFASSTPAAFSKPKTLGIRKEVLSAINSPKKVHFLNLTGKKDKENIAPSPFMKRFTQLEKKASPSKSPKKKIFVSHEVCSPGQVDASKIFSPTMTPAAKRDEKRKKKQQELDRKREAVVKKLNEEVAKAEGKVNMKKPHMEHEKHLVEKGCCSSHLEDVLLKELNQEQHPRKLFLLSLSETVLDLPLKDYRNFQQQVLALLSQYESEPVQSGKFQLTPQQMVEVKRLQETLPNEKVTPIVYARDLHLLKGCQWLNDQIINAYFSLIENRSNAHKDLPRVKCMSTFFLPMLIEKGYDHVKDWNTMSNLPEADKFLVPVHKASHWTLIVADLKAHTITYCDSFRGEYSDAINAVKSFLIRKTVQFEWTCVPKSVDMPMQSNGYDCGVFVCMYANQYSLNQNIDFNECDIPDIRNRIAYEIGKEALL